jgi:DNA-directed RNA polymerase subunit RPC12/RpoP
LVYANPGQADSENTKQKGAEMEIKENSRSVTVDLSFPTEITCPVCGFEVDLWSEKDDETRCYICGFRFFQKERLIH